MTLTHRRQAKTPSKARGADIEPKKGRVGGMWLLTVASRESLRDCSRPRRAILKP